MNGDSNSFFLLFFWLESMMIIIDRHNHIMFNKYPRLSKLGSYIGSLKVGEIVNRRIRS